MKNVLLILVFFFSIHQIADAQIDKGYLLAGGNIQFSSEKDSESKVTSFHFSPAIGYFFADKFALGLRTGFSSMKMEELDAVTDFIIGPFVRYYLLPKENKVNLLADADFQFGSSKLGDNTLSQNVFSVSAGPVVFLNKHTGMEFKLGFSSSKLEDFTDRTNAFNMLIGLQVHLGNGK
jgi:hypothetical protein